MRIGTPEEDGAVLSQTAGGGHGHMTNPGANFMCKRRGDTEVGTDFYHASVAFGRIPQDGMRKNWGRRERARSLRG